MKLLIMILFLVSCQYQQDDLNQVQLSSTCRSDDFTVTSEKFTEFETKLTAFYKKYVKILDCNFDTRVDYQSMLNFKHNNPTEYQKNRKKMLDLISNEDLADKSDNYKKAFLINSYNYVAIDIVLKNSSKKLIESISDLGGAGSFNAFSDDENFGYGVAGMWLSLDGIEKEELADISNNEDARTHFAVICVSVGCPVLLDVAFNEKDLDEQLNFVTRAGLRLPRMFSLGARKVTLSSIFDWYKQDFINEASKDQNCGSEENCVKVFLRKYLDKEISVDNLKIDYVRYNWDLNKV